MKHKLLHPSRWGVALLLAVCTVACDTESGLPDTPPEGGNVPVGFSVGVGAPAATRASGELTTANLTSMGVFAYYTGQSNWNAATHTPNFMYNQRVTRTGSSAPWTYTPVKYWPNTAGDKISFVAYAPHTSDTPGLTVKSGTGAGTAGYPQLYYDLPVDASLQKDLLAATALTNKTKSTSSAAFTMKHVLTRVLVNARCSDAIRVTKVKVNSIQAGYGTLTWNSGSNPVWSSFTSVMNSEYSTATDVPANAANATQIAEYFLYPKTATGKLEVTFTIGGNSETKSVDIPASPAWEMGKTIAYTLNIEVGSEVTLTVKAWDTNSANNGTMGEEVPTTGYPFMKNGILYESSTKYYYLGLETLAGNPFENNYNYAAAIDLCKNKYTLGIYPSKEWRLPNINELVKIRSCGGTPYNSTYWSISSIDDNNAYLISNIYDPKGSLKSYECRVICIRDVGEITPPTLRRDKEFNVIYRTESNVYMETVDYNFFGNYAEAVAHCNSLTSGGYTDWRLPTADEYEGMHSFGIKWSTCWSSTSRSTGTHVVYVDTSNPWNKPDTESCRTYCVRDY